MFKSTAASLAFFACRVDRRATRDDPGRPAPAPGSGAAEAAEAEAAWAAYEAPRGKRGLEARTIPHV